MRTSLRAGTRTGAGGSRFLYEPFDSAHARVEALERVLDERWASLEQSLKSMNQAVDRLEKRLWVAVFGVATAMIGQFGTALFERLLQP